MSDATVRHIDVAYSGPVSLPRYEARLTVTRTEDTDTVISVIVVGTSRIVDQVIHAATDAFREEVER